MSVVRFKIENETWRAVILVSAGEPKEPAQKYFHKKLEHDFGEGNPFSEATSFLLGDDKSVAIWFRDLDPTAGTIAHEALHATKHILEKSGIYLTDETEEAYCYLLGWVVRKITEKLW